MSEPLFAALRCDPETPSPDLVAVDAAERLILDEAAPALTGAADRAVVVIGDRYGALTLGAIDRFQAVDVRTSTDRLTSEAALAANARRVGLDDRFRVLGLTPELVTGATVVLIRLPRSLDALDEIAGLVARHAAPEVVVVAGGREKHMSLAMNEALGRYFGEVRASRGRQKSRVLHARAPRPQGEVRAWPVSAWHADLGLTVCAHGAAFAGARVDIGTRFLTEHLAQAVPDARSAVDLGCGTGVLAAVLAAARPQVEVVATDESAAAVRSARATVAANGLDGRVRVQRARGTDGIADGSVDLVVLNPPFHVGAALHDRVADGLFADAARVLRPGGELWCVWNSGLGYRPRLRALVGETRQVARNSKFTITASVRA